MIESRLSQELTRGALGATRCFRRLEIRPRRCTCYPWRLVDRVCRREPSLRFEDASTSCVRPSGACSRYMIVGKCCVVSCVHVDLQVLLHKVRSSNACSVLEECTRKRKASEFTFAVRSARSPVTHTRSAPHAIIVNISAKFIKVRLIISSWLLPPTVKPTNEHST